MTKLVTAWTSQTLPRLRKCRERFVRRLASLLLYRQRMNGTRILATGGIVSGLVASLGGALGSVHAMGFASAVMLAANVVALLIRR